VLPAVVIAEPQGTEGEDGFDTGVEPELLGAFGAFVELFDAGVGHAAADGPVALAVVGVVRRVGVSLEAGRYENSDVFAGSTGVRCGR